MFKNLFSKAKPAPAAKSQSTSAAGDSNRKAMHESLMHAINEKRKVDPLIGAKIAGKEVLERLLGLLKTDRGVHVESLLCALGSLAGYACQASLREQALEKGLAESAVFMVVGTKDGGKYFFGDPLNERLAQSAHSVWALAAGAAQHNGCTSLPDLNAIFAYVTSTVGDNNFGVPRIPEGHLPGELPIAYLKPLWPAMLAAIKPFCNSPEEWPVAFSVAIQSAMDMGKAAIAPDLALTIVMESAIPMSKIDLKIV